MNEPRAWVEFQQRVYSHDVAWGGRFHRSHLTLFIVRHGALGLSNVLERVAIHQIRAAITDLSLVTVLNDYYVTWVSLLEQC